jgi:hypothetical protein
MEKTLLIIGDPKGTASLSALKKYAPENIWVWENDSRHIYTINQICDRIKVVTDLNSLDNMHFSRTIGNPPYLKSIHLEFLLKALEISDSVSLIHPAGWLFRRGNKLEKSVHRALKGRVKKLVIFNGNAKFVGARFGCPLVITTAVKEHTGPIEVVYETTGNKYYIDSLEDMPTGFWEPTPTHLETVDKFKELCRDTSVFDLLKTYDGSGAAISTPRVCGHANFLSTPRVCGNQTTKAEDFVSYDYYTFFYRNSDINTIDPKNKVFHTQTEEEKNSLISYLKTKFARFGLSIHKISQDAHISRYLSSVPLPPLDRDWTDTSIMEYYGLSEDQQSLINSFIFDYYV